MVNLDDLKNIEAEEEVLNFIMVKPYRLHDISRILRADDFYREAHRMLYGAMSEMILAKEPLDIVTLTEKLRHDGTLDKVGFGTIKHIGMVGVVGCVEAQAEIIAEHSRRRRLVEKARALEVMAADFKQDIERLAYDFANDVSGMTATADENTKTAKDAAMELAALIDQRSARQGEMLNTGLADVDKYLTGLEPGQLIVIAGRPGHGKTALAGTIAVNMAQRGKRILMFSMEMSREEMLGRFVSRIGGLSGEKLKKPNDMSQDEWDRYIKGLDEVSKLPLTINSQGALTPADVASIAARWESNGGIDVIVIDYLQLMNSGNRSDNRVQEISYITRSLKNLAVNLKVPIILLSQLSRANDKENRAPKLTDLRDSGSIEQDANTVLLIHRESHLSDDMKTQELTNKTFVNIAKQRDGECGTVLVTFIPSRGYFVNYIDEGRYEAKGFTPPV